ncbi:MAG TPA: asparaginase domain-containing protein [Candidatus Binatia bacterium]
MAAQKPRIAIFSGATATIQNSPPLVTSNKAREQYGLPLRRYPDGTPLRFDGLRAQRLAAPVTVYIEQFSAHPLEPDAAELYAPPDGYVDPDGRFHEERQGPRDVPVYKATLRPEDGVYPLPYMARQANGQPWEGDGTGPGAPAPQCRQPYYPDGTRIIEEIDRLGIGESGLVNELSSMADFHFYRAAPSGGYKKGLPEAVRTDVGSGDIPPESLGRDFFVYRPGHLRCDPDMDTLARLTNTVQGAMASGKYEGAVWLEGSPNVEETCYWLNLLIDTTVPISGNASQRPHGQVANDGDRNIIDSVTYIVSRVWADAEGRDEIGAVVIMDQQIFTSREVQKADARPGGYTATGGHGGVVGTVGHGPAAITFKPVRRHTYTSAVNMNRLPDSVQGVRLVGGRHESVAVRVKDGAGRLIPAAIPTVTIEKTARYRQDATQRAEVGVLALIEKNLREGRLAGFVAEGAAPYGSMVTSMSDALERASLCGMPVVKVGRGNAEGFTPARPNELAIAGSNLTATKARLLLMACLMKLGSLPPAADPDRPSGAEMEAIRAKLAAYREIFNTH